MKRGLSVLAKKTTLVVRRLIHSEIDNDNNSKQHRSDLQSIFMKKDKQAESELLQGTLDLLVLKALAGGPLHGLGVSRRIELITKVTFSVKPGSLFPALHRLEEAGYLKSFWGTSENNRRAKYYRLSKSGRQQLEAETQDWQRISIAIAAALEAT
jgi:PadR family transcriptional regulator, regulatory protein PadR